MFISNKKWLSLAIGGLAASAAFALTGTVPARNIGNPLFLFAVMMLMDCAIAYHVIPYATINGPDERRAELERRFYEWPRTKLRYIYIFLTSLAAMLAVQYFGLGDFYLYGMVIVVAGYCLIAIIQVFSCRRQAGALYPPNGN